MIHKLVLQFFQLPKITQDQLISFWILGYAREVIESMFHVSHGTIQNIVAQYTKSDPLIPLLRQIATTIKNSGLRIEEYAFNLRIIQAIARMNCPTEWIESFLIRVENEYISTNRPIEELVTTLSEIAEFIALRKISVEQALQSLKELMQEITRIESEIDKTEKMRHQSDQALKEALSKNKISMEKVDDFVAFRAQLKENGFTTNDIRKCCNLLLKIKKSGFDVKKLAPLLEAVDDLQDLKDRLEKHCLQVSCTIRDQMEYKDP